MSQNTDFYAQLMDEANGKDTAAAKILSMDLSLAPECPLAKSIAMICQGVIGSLIAENGGWNRKQLVSIEDLTSSGSYSIDLQGRSIINLGYTGQHNEAVSRMSLEDVIFQKIQAHINEHHQTINIPIGGVEEIRDRVNKFKLIEEKQ